MIIVKKQCEPSKDGILDNNFMKNENLNKLYSMSKFKNNWNGNGGITFPQETINHFKNILEHLVKQPQIAPTGRRSLLMQYKSHDGSILAFEVKETKVDMVYVPENKYDNAVFKIFNDNFIDKINFEVEHFYKL